MQRERRDLAPPRRFTTIGSYETAVPTHAPRCSVELDLTGDEPPASAGDVIRPPLARPARRWPLCRQRRPVSTSQQDFCQRRSDNAVSTSRHRQVVAPTLATGPRRRGRAPADPGWRRLNDDQEPRPADADKLSLRRWQQDHVDEGALRRIRAGGVGTQTKSLDLPAPTSCRSDAGKTRSTMTRRSGIASRAFGTRFRDVIRHPIDRRFRGSSMHTKPARRHLTAGSPPRGRRRRPGRTPTIRGSVTRRRPGRRRKSRRTRHRTARPGGGWRPPAPSDRSGARGSR